MLFRSFITFDIATYLDVLALAWALATIVHIKSVLASLRGMVRKLHAPAQRFAARMRRASRRRVRGARKPRQKDSDGKDGQAWWPGSAGLAFSGV